MNVSELNKEFPIQNDFKRILKLIFPNTLHNLNNAQKSEYLDEFHDSVAFNFCQTAKKYGVNFVKETSKETSEEGGQETEGGKSKEVSMQLPEAESLFRITENGLLPENKVFEIINQTLETPRFQEIAANWNKAIRKSC